MTTHSDVNPPAPQDPNANASAENAPTQPPKASGDAPSPKAPVQASDTAPTSPKPSPSETAIPTASADITRNSEDAAAAATSKQPSAEPAENAPSNPEPAIPESARPEPTRPSAAMDAAIQREVDAAMAGMSADELAAVTVGGAQASAEGVQLGRIEAVRGDDVFITLGGKSQGVLTKAQFKPGESMAVGEPVEVVIDRYDRESDLLILSRKGQARSVEWDLLKPGDVVEGRVVGLNRGGLEVQLKGVKGFMPASQVDVMHVKDISILLNEVVKCEVLEIDRKGRRLTLSRRAVLEKERAAKREEMLKELEPGQVRKGVVGNLADFGAFVDLGGVDGLIHISDLSWGQIKHPSEVVNTGDIVEVKVLKVQKTDEKLRISLGFKQAQPDPWENVADQFPVESTQRVRVVRLADFGAFVELTRGIEGLVPISEMAWSRIHKPAEVVSVGETVDAKVIRVEPKRHRIALSIKQAKPDPWAGVLESYEPDTQVKGKVTKLMDFGAFVEIAPGVEGLVHISELAERRINSCAEVVKPGQEVTARVLKVDPESRRISLSLKPQSKDKPEAPAASLDLGKSKPKRKDRKLRGGLSSEWDWSGVGLDKLNP